MYNQIRMKNQLFLKNMTPYSKRFNRHQYIRYCIREYKKSIGCEICKKEFDPVALDLHHKDPEMKKFTISQFNKVKKITNSQLLKELDKCIVVCANCHRKLTWNK